VDLDAFVTVHTTQSSQRVALGGRLLMF
jgi:hypothetical protein